MTTVQNNNTTPTSLVVIYAPPGMAGHLFPTVEFGKLLVVQGLEVTVVLSGVGDADDLTRTRAANPSLSFHCLPTPMLPSADADSFEAKVFGLAHASLQDLRDFLRSASPAALVIDFFCASAFDVGAELRIPTYFFLTTCISVVAFGLYQPAMDEQTTLSFQDLGGDLVHAPGLPPIPADHLPAFTLDRNSLSTKLFRDVPHQLCNSQGIIVNSCRSWSPVPSTPSSPASAPPDGQRRHCTA